MKQYSSFTKVATPPLIGALLRRPLHAVRQRIHSELRAAGFDDVHPAHLAVFQHPPPRGVRPTDLASAAGITKQAMNHLLGQLEDLGYIERRPLDNDARAKGIWLTERGERATRTIRRAVLAVEHDWEKALGPSRFRKLHALLVELGQQLPS